MPSGSPLSGLPSMTERGACAWSRDLEHVEMERGEARVREGGGGGREGGGARVQGREGEGQKRLAAPPHPENPNTEIHPGRMPAPHPPRWRGYARMCEPHLWTILG